MTDASRRDETTAARGARWMAVAVVVVGLLNYGYAVLLMHLLSVTAYSRFAAGQGLILWASTVAIVSVPWLLAQALVRAESEAERYAAIRFARLVSVGSGCAAAVVVGAIATRFAGLTAALVLGLSVLVIFLGTTTTGWLQGQERLGLLSVLTVAENMLKVAAGVLLVMVARLGEAGALGAFGIGALVLLLAWPRTPRDGRGSWLAALANRDLWCRVGVIAGAQGMVSLFVAVDVVLVALLPGSRVLAASYQASAAISRVPLYFAAAVATAFFPSLSRHAAGGMIAARAVRMYASMALPVAVVLATVPAPVADLILSSQYGSVVTLLKYTALTGLAAGGVSLVTAFFQAAGDYSVLRWLGAGLAGYVLALLAGWRVAGITGLAAGGTVGATVSLTLVGYRLIRRQGFGVLALVPLVEPGLAAVVLILLRPYPWPWLAVAAVAGLRAVGRFVRPGARHVRGPRWAAAGWRPGDEPASSLVIEVAWRGAAPRVTDADLRQALDLARRNRVEGRLACAYPDQLAELRAENRAAVELFNRRLGEVMEGLRRAGVPAVLIPAGLPSDHAGASIEIVVPERERRRALTVLGAPAGGPPLRLHTSASWFGIPVLSGERLLSAARRNRHGLLIPAPADYLRIRLAQALYQDLVLDLSGLLAVHSLRHPAIVTDARDQARREGWQPGFDDVLAAAGDAIDRLDRGLPVALPVPLPLAPLFGAAPPPSRREPLAPAIPGRRPAGAHTRCVVSP